MTSKSSFVLWQAREPMLRERLVRGVVMKIKVLISSVRDVIDLSRDPELEYQEECVHGVDTQMIVLTYIVRDAGG